MTTQFHGVDEINSTDDADIAPQSGNLTSAAPSESVSSVPFLVISSLGFFLSVGVVAISALFGTANVDPAAGGTAHAEPLRPAETRNVNLGSIAGVAFYTVEPENYRLAIGLQELETGTPMRFITTLGPEQQVTLAVPQADGEHEAEVNFVRHGDRVEMLATTLTRDPGAPSD